MNAIPAVDTARLEAAATAGVTRGPWHWVDYRNGTSELAGVGGEPGVYEYATEVIEVDHDGGCGCRRECTIEMNIAAADREWIAAANPDIITALIAERDLLRAAVTALQAGGQS